MKRIFFIIFSLIMVSSCLDDGSGTTQRYQGRADFEYGAGAQFLPDSTFFNTRTPDGFGYDALNFYHQLDPGKIRVDGGFTLSRLEGIIPAIESSHAVAYGMKLAKTMDHGSVLINLSGRGDKDMDYIIENYGIR